MDNFPHLVGLAAGLLTTGAFLPQSVKAWRSRRTRDVSLNMLVLFVAGILLWLAYGVMTGDVPLIAANGATLAIAVSIIVAKLRFG